MLLGMEVRMIGQYFPESSSFFYTFKSGVMIHIFKMSEQRSLAVHNTLIINLELFSGTQFQNAFLDV